MKGKQALAVISFGTSFRDTMEKTIAAIENGLKQAFPDRKFYRAFTSQIIRKKIRERDGEIILSPEEALRKMAEDGIRDVLIQPTHMLAGEEFEKIKAALKPVLSGFDRVLIGSPLLESETDIRNFADVAANLFPDLKKEQMAVFMGHGSAALALPVWDLLQERWEDTGHENFCIGTVEFEPGIGPVLEKIRMRKPEKVVLSPFLVVAGDHAQNDMAGDDPDSWKMRIAAEGCPVDCIMKGLGEYPQIRALYVKKALEAKPL